MGGVIIKGDELLKKVTRAKSGDKKAMEEVIISFKPFVIKTALSTYIKGYDMEDLIQIGEMSIIKAVNMFDNLKSNSFITYVTNAIKINFYELIRKNIKSASVCSLNSVNKEGYEIIDSLVSEENIEDEIIKEEENMDLKRALSLLKAEDKEIIYYFYFQKKTLQEYRKEKGIGYRTAVDRKKRALGKLKKILKEWKTYGNI